MIGDDIQNQSGGDASTNIQARNVFLSGISATEARQIALDVYRANIAVLSQEAVATARERAEKITDAFIAKVTQESSDLLGELRKPGMQLALFAAQKEYARTGDETVEQLLVSLLADRAKERERNLKQIALEEAVNVVPKLTQKQADILTLTTLVNDHYFQAASLPALRHYLSSVLMRFKVTVRFRSPDIRHLEFTGCAKVAPPTSGNKGLDHKLRDSYPGLFPKGFTKEQFAAAIPDAQRYDELLVPSGTEGKWQFNCISVEGINQFFKQRGLGNDEKKPLFDFLKSTAMDTREVRAYLLELEPGINFLFGFDNRDILDLDLTPVGVVIACANYSSKTGQQLSWPYYMYE